MSMLEMMLRGLGVASLGLLAAALLRSPQRRDDAARIGAGLCLSVAAFMLSSMPGAARLLGVAAWPLTAVCATHPVWFWLFCAALFGDSFRLRRIHVLCLAAMALAGLIYQALLQPAPFDAPPGLVRLVGVGFAAASLMFIALGPLTVYAGRRDDLDERRRRIRAWFVPAVSVYLATIVVVQLWAMFAGRYTPAPLVAANLAIIDLLAMLALASFLRIRVVNWLSLTGEPPSAAEALSNLERGVLDRLERRFASERLYARNGLTIAALADELHTQEHILRRVINRSLGFRNFNDFLHSHRLREASARLRDPGARRVPVLTIALDVGYGSIGPFNRAFRERFGVTPTGYRRATAEEAAHAAETALRTQAAPR
jgi:AraC-like DNA-binding protein